MAPAVFFLLLGVLMQELSLFGMRTAPILGVLCLVSSALALAVYRRRTRASASSATVLAAMGRAARARATARPHPAIRVVR